MFADKELESKVKTAPSSEKSIKSSKVKSSLNPRRIKFSNTIQKFANYFYRRQYFKQDALMRKWALVDTQKGQENVQSISPKKFSTCKETLGKPSLGKSKNVYLVHLLL